jgi:hypothetical protein
VNARARSSEAARRRPERVADPSHKLGTLVAAFGAEAKRKLANPGIAGAPEDQLRAPLEALIPGLADAVSVVGRVTMVGETTLTEHASRPDYAVTVNGALTGFVEVKAPGKGADPRRYTDPHDQAQWKRLRALPNLIYTDGEGFTLWQEGELVHAAALDGTLETAGSRLRATPDLPRLIKAFFDWNPIPPRTPQDLARVAARLCRLLRDTVAEETERGLPALSGLAAEWRTLLFPEATTEQFADGYAQAVTFGLLMARARDITLDDTLEGAARALRQANTTLIGTALRLLTDDPDIRASLSTALKTLVRVLNQVNWAALTRGRPDAWLYFYEDFLDVYDRSLRKRTGSYYTPPEVVDAMVRLTDEALRDPALFGRPRGLADRDVQIADPAVGTGTFLLGILRRIAATVGDDLGPGSVAPELAAAASRLYGFELQFGPFAVAQLRLLAEMQALVGGAGTGANLPVPNLYVTDTLGDPYAAQTRFSTMVAPIGESRREANRVKREAPITVVIGNPPYKEKARGRGGWVEAGGTGPRTPMDLWTPPVDWGVSAHAKHLKNLYVYFWRWATWKVFGSDLAETSPQPDEDRGGIVCFIKGGGVPQWPRLPEDAGGTAPRCLGDLGHRLHPRTAPARRVEPHLPGGAATRLHRHRGAGARQGPGSACAPSLPRPSGRAAGGQVRRTRRHRA